MFIGFIAMSVTALLWPKQLWYLIGAIICVVAVFVIFRVDNKDEKKHMDKYANSHKKKLDILQNVLSTTFNITTKEKVEDLINIYQEFVDKKIQAEKRRNNIIFILFSVLSGVLTISFENMGVMGLDFVSWLCLAMLLLLLVALISMCIHFCACFDTVKVKYEIMINDLKQLLVYKY